MYSSLLAIAAISLVTTTRGFNVDCNSNVAGYWGQNSYGAANGGDKSNWQKPLHVYCNDDTIDMFPVAFLTTFFGAGGQPEINLANICSSTDEPTFPGTALANCTSQMQDDIVECQKRGKVLTLSLGGATGGVGFQSDGHAEGFADTIWNLFLGGSSNIRPFGSAILDGVDLDIEGGGSAHYIAFLNKLKSHFDLSNRKYYITAAPQCVYPDANLQDTMNAFPMDAVFVQFYNNPCGLQTYGQPQWNFGQWDHWARNISPNKNIKVYIGAPASSSAAGSGYVSVDQLARIAADTQRQFASFGGVMYWDVSQAYANNRFDKAIKEAINQGSTCSGSSSFPSPSCDAPDYTPGQVYTGGSKVSYKYIWQAKWWTNSAPSGNSNSDWMPVGSCGSSDNGSSLSPSSSSILTNSSISISATMMISVSTTSAPGTIRSGQPPSMPSVWSSVSATPTPIASSAPSNATSGNVGSVTSSSITSSATATMRAIGSVSSTAQVSSTSTTSATSLGISSDTIRPSASGNAATPNIGTQLQKNHPLSRR